MITGIHSCILIVIGNIYILKCSCHVSCFVLLGLTLFLSLLLEPTILQSWLIFTTINVRYTHCTSIV